MDTFLPNNSILAILISLIVNILIAIAGILPSTFLTAANLLYFGFGFGLVVSILGEAFGAIISFYIYRKGLKAIEGKYKGKRNHRFLQRLKESKGSEAMLLVLGLRILPFIPSGLVTLTASLSKMKLTHFALASTIGKIPALFIEAFSIYSVFKMQFEYQMGLALIGAGIVLLYYLIIKRTD